jgi:hypothetical protein
MPFDIRMADQYLDIRLHGTLTDKDLVSLGDAVLAAETATLVTPFRVTDMASVDRLEVGFNEVLALADRRRATPVSRPIRSAIVVGNPVQYGMARMFQTLNDHPMITVEMFHDRAPAIEWLLAIDQ